MTQKTVLLIFHVLGVICGVGGVLMLDMHLLRHLRGARIATQDMQFTRFVSTFVKAGLIAVWLSGLLIIASAPDGAASVLANPKLQAKLVVVVVLTINALFIETLALPLLARNVGRPLFDGLDQVQRTIVLGCGAISTLSWLFPIILGLARELNQVTPAQTILTYYAAALAVLGATIQVLGRVIYRPLSTTDELDETATMDRRSALEEIFSMQTQSFADAETRATSAVHAQDPLRLAREAGYLTLLDCVSLDSVVQVFATLQTEMERQQFRIGMFEALREQSGKDVEGLVAALAGDEVLRRKVAAVAPQRTTSTVGRDRSVVRDSGTKWSAAEEWHDMLLDMTSRVPTAASSRVQAAA